MAFWDEPFGDAALAFEGEPDFFLPRTLALDGRPPEPFAGFFFGLAFVGDFQLGSALSIGEPNSRAVRSGLLRL